MKKVFKSLVGIVVMMSVIAMSVCSVSAGTFNWNLYNTGTATGNHTTTNCNYSNSTSSTTTLSYLSPVGMNEYVLVKLHDLTGDYSTFRLRYSGDSRKVDHNAVYCTFTVEYHSTGMGSANGNFVY